MLVQMSFTEVLELPNGYKGHALCRRCGREIGPVALDELAALMSGKYGDVLCFSCEEYPPQPMFPLSRKIEKNLLSLFQVESLLDVPVHGFHCWSNSRQDTALQLTLTMGWCLWILTPSGGRWELKRVHLSANDAQIYKETFCMSPCQCK